MPCYCQSYLGDTEVQYIKACKLAVCPGLGNSDDNEKILANRFIEAIEEKNRKYGIPDKIEALREEDIHSLAVYADKEANPSLPLFLCYGI